MRYTTIECNDAFKVIETHDSEETFVYTDPPYIDTAQGHYGGYTEEHYRRDLETLAAMKGKFLLSSYPSAILDEFIEKYGWYTRTVDRSLSASNAAGSKVRKRKVEVLTANYQIE